MSRSAVLVVLKGWLIVALVVGWTNVLAHLPVPPPFIAVALTIALLVLLRTSRRVQTGATSLGARALVVFHVIRLPIGAYFLLLEARGVLPSAFATPAGWGDIIVGLTAIPVALLCCPVTTPGRRMVLLVWNVVGLLDILGVIGNALRIFMGDPEFVAPFVTLPLSLLPTFIVPLVIVSHVILFTFGPRSSATPR
jgi:hypothetical protein